jgi:hypothetical protein
MYVVDLFPNKAKKWVNQDIWPYAIKFLYILGKKERQHWHRHIPTYITSADTVHHDAVVMHETRYFIFSLVDNSCKHFPTWPEY